MIQVQPQCPLCGSWNVKRGQKEWNHCQRCGIWFNTNTGEHEWCLFGTPEN